MSGSADPTGIVPAALSYLTIYNPTLGESDETVHDQIIYHFRNSRDGQKPHKGVGARQEQESRGDINSRLREVGLAQATVQFASDFSDGFLIDSIETAKSRTVIHNLEGDWWLLASIDFTCITRSSGNNTLPLSSDADQIQEYSSREVAPPKLLIQQLLRAHSVFLLHHAASLTDLWSHASSRDKFCATLERFWDRVLWKWDVLLRGNPAVDIYNGIKLSAGGELGIGVGEEDWGSGEREVLEGFVQRTDGLVDLVVSRFDQKETVKGRPHQTSPVSQSVTDEEQPQPYDGVIFSGVGAVTRSSVRNITAWMEWLAMYGTNCYGVRENPTADPRRRRAKEDRSQHSKEKNHQNYVEDAVGGKAIAESRYNPGIPSPIVRPEGVSRSNLHKSSKANGAAAIAQKQQNLNPEDSAIGTEVVKYLTFGIYGSSWGISAGRPSTQGYDTKRSDDKDKAVSDHRKGHPDPAGRNGYFLIGLLGDVDEDAENEAQNENIGTANGTSSGQHGRLLMRHLHVERTERAAVSSRDDDTPEGHHTTSTYNDRLRVVVYVHAPFIFTFLFEPQTDSLALPFFYRAIHHQVGPLRRPLLKSTDPVKVTKRLLEVANARSTSQARNVQSIQDLVHDPNRLTVHTSIPNIPEPGLDTSSSPLTWSRVEALGVHSQILNTYISSRRHCSEIERTCKTSRGWWVVWMRLPHSCSAGSEQQQQAKHREAILIRRAHDQNVSKARQSGSAFSFGLNRGVESGGGWQAKLAEGIGIDARQYIEGLLSLSR